jgi:hypothetical protein
MAARSVIRDLMAGHAGKLVDDDAAAVTSVKALLTDGDAQAALAFWLAYYNFTRTAPGADDGRRWGTYTDLVEGGGRLFAASLAVLRRVDLDEDTLEVVLWCCCGPNAMFVYRAPVPHTVLMLGLLGLYPDATLAIARKGARTCCGFQIAGLMLGPARARDMAGFKDRTLQHKVWLLQRCAGAWLRAADVHGDVAEEVQRLVRDVLWGVLHGKAPVADVDLHAVEALLQIPCMSAATPVRAQCLKLLAELVADGHVPDV